MSDNFNANDCKGTSDFYKEIKRESNIFNESKYNKEINEIKRMIKNASNSGKYSIITSSDIFPNNKNVQTSNDCTFFINNILKNHPDFTGFKIEELLTRPGIFINSHIKISW